MCADATGRSGNRREVKTLDSRIPMLNIETMDDILSHNQNLAHARFRTFLLGMFAIVSLLLAAIGLYGLLTQTVLQRTHEIGIRVALGGRRDRIIRLVVTRALFLSGIGIIAGLVASSYLTRFLQGLLYEVKASEPVILLVTSGVLLAVTLTATYFPARRAARVDPMIALRHE
jgi:putative ABC transport system permease protein